MDNVTVTVFGVNIKSFFNGANSSNVDFVKLNVSNDYVNVTNVYWARTIMLRLYVYAVALPT